MVLAENPLPDGEPALNERLGAGALKLPPMKLTQQVQAVGDFWMCASENGLPKCKRMLAVWNSVGVPARLQEPLRFAKGRLRLQQPRIRPGVLGHRLRRTAQHGYRR